MKFFVGGRSAAENATPPKRNAHFRPPPAIFLTKTNTFVRAGGGSRDRPPRPAGPFLKENQHCIGAGRGVPGPPVSAKNSEILVFLRQVLAGNEIGEILALFLL